MYKLSGVFLQAFADDNACRAQHKLSSIPQEAQSDFGMKKKGSTARRQALSEHLSKGSTAKALQQAHMADAAVLCDTCSEGLQSSQVHACNILI